MLWSPTFDPTKTVLVEQPVLAAGPAGGTGTALIEGNGEDTLAVRVRSNGPALLAISRTFHPSWQAEIDGAPVSVVRANHALMAVPLNRGGEHRVILRYRPTIVRLAAGISATTWLIVLLGTGLGLVLRRRQRRV